MLRAPDRFVDVHLSISRDGLMMQEAVAARQFLEAALANAEIVIWYGIPPSGELYRGFCTERMIDERILSAHTGSTFEEARDKAEAWREAGLSE